MYDNQQYALYSTISKYTLGQNVAHKVGFSLNPTLIKIQIIPVFLRILNCLIDACNLIKMLNIFKINHTLHILIFYH